MLDETRRYGVGEKARMTGGAGARPQRRLRGRGRVTLIVLAAIAAGFAGLLGEASGGPADPDAAAALERPAVALQPPEPEAEPAARPEAPPQVPDAVLRRLLPVSRDILESPPVLVAAADSLRDGRDSETPPALFETVALETPYPGIPSPLHVEYTLDPELERRVFETFEQGNVRLGQVIVLEPATGRVLAYASTDVERFPPTRTYPAASLIKVVTAAAALHHARAQAEQPCRFLGSPYQLTPKRIDPPRKGNTVTLERALATSNNQCFAQLAVHALGTEALVDAISRFGFLREPAPGHAAGIIDRGVDRYDLGRLGCGLSGCWITPLHAAQMAAILAQGRLVQPWWIQRVTDARGRQLKLPLRQPTRQVLTPELARELRSMLVETTLSGTARRAFRDASGQPTLGAIRVAGKTGSLSGHEPDGRYEWFAGVAPAENPKVAIAAVVVQHGRYWMHASEVAAEVLRSVFCKGGVCAPELRAKSAAAKVTRPRDARRGRS